MTYPFDGRSLGVDALARAVDWDAARARFNASPRRCEAEKFSRAYFADATSSRNRSSASWKSCPLLS